MKSAQKIFLRDLLLIFLLVLSLAIYLYSPVLSDPYRFHNNWRQSPHWISLEKQNFHPDDLLLRYAEFNTSPFGDWLYKTLALTGHDIIWGKLNTILFFTAMVLLIFIIGRKLYNRWAGWIAVVIILFFPSIFKEFSGGFMSALSAPLLCLTLMVIATRKWIWAVPLLAFQAISYPMVAVHSGMIFLVDILINDRKQMFNRLEWRNKYLPLLLAILISVALMSGKYLESQHEFGQLVTRTEIQDRDAFKWEGRYPLIPVKSLWFQLEERWFDWFHLLLFLIPFYFLAKGFFRLPRGLPALFISSLIMYVLADIFLMKLYIPDRYLHYSLPIFMALAGGNWWARAFDQKSNRSRILSLGRFHLPVRPVILSGIVVAGLGFMEFRTEFVPGQKTDNYNSVKLYRYIRKLPGRPMLAMHPRRASNIPTLTGKSVLISEELGHPWWTEYWNKTEIRTKDFFRAYYATEPDTIRAFIKRYDIGYWVVEPRHFSYRYLKRRKQYYMEPFDRWMQQEMQLSPTALLNRLPRAQWEFYDGRYYVISSARLLDWLND